MFVLFTSICLNYISNNVTGHIGLVDYDEIDKTNLHRQILYTTNDIGLRKVKAAALLLKRYIS